MTDEKKLQLPPENQLILRVKTMPNDANALGSIFGGWLMSQIDIAGAEVAWERARGPVSTIAVNHLTFLKPLFIHDLVSFYGQLVKVGNTSLTVAVQAYVQRPENMQQIEKISDAEIVYVAVSKPGVKREVPR